MWLNRALWTSDLLSHLETSYSGLHEFSVFSQWLSTTSKITSSTDKNGRIRKWQLTGGGKKQKKKSITNIFKRLRILTSSAIERTVLSMSRPLRERYVLMATTDFHEG